MLHAERGNASSAAAAPRMATKYVRTRCEAVKKEVVVFSDRLNVWIAKNDGNAEYIVGFI